MRGPIPAQGPFISRAQGPIDARATLSRASIVVYLCSGLILARTHPCSGPIYFESPRAHPCQGPVHIEGTSLPKAHLSRGPMVAHSCPVAIHGEGPSLSRAHSVRRLPGAHSWQGLSIPRAHGCPSIPRAHLYPRLIHAEGPSLPMAHPSRYQGLMGPFMPSSYPCRGPIPAQSISILRAHGSQ